MFVNQEKEKDEEFRAQLQKEKESHLLQLKKLELHVRDLMLILFKMDKKINAKLILLCFEFVSASKCPSTQ